MPYGSSAWGTSPFGSWVPLAIVSCKATSTNTIEVTLTAEPLNESPITLGDALNPSSWQCYTDTNSFTILAVRKVSNLVYELRTLQKLKNRTITHTVRTYTLRDPIGIYVTAPYSANCLGVVAVLSNDYTMSYDLHSDPIGADGFGGTLRVGPSGSYDRVYGSEMLKKLIIRRLITHPGSYFHIPREGYGTDLGIKQTINASKLPELQQLITRNVLLEPNVTDVKVSLKLQKDGILVIGIKASADFGPVDVSIRAGG